jgi:hypothetical protein
MAFSDWSTTASSNSTTLGVNIGEGCPPSNVNNAIRQVMADMRTAISPTLAAFLASTSLSQARSALEVASPTSSASLTAFGNLTNAANQLPYMTGSDAWATTDFTSFGRSVVATGDANALNTLLGAVGLTSATFGSGTIDLRLKLGADTLCIKGGSGTLGANSTTTLNFGVTFATAPVCIVCGGDNNTSNEGDIRSSGVATTTGIAIINAGPGVGSYNWLAIGKL